MAKVLVTGCAGFIESHAAEYFLNAGWDVVGIDNFSGKGVIENTRCSSPWDLNLGSK
jgi:nucleoside-diphosphate-sugar epimerase